MSQTHAPSAGDAILSVNAGSSSLKFALYPCVDGGIGPPWLSGQVDGLQPGGEPAMRVLTAQHQESSIPVSSQRGASAFQAALRAVIAAVDTVRPLTLRAIAHRIVHGGEYYAAATLIDEVVLGRLGRLSDLAPLHQPHNLAGVRAFMRAFPGQPQVGCFDTAFHADIPEVERWFALPESFHEAGIRRYGFHGLSYKYVAMTLGTITPRGRGRLLLAHLGNGASLCAVRDGRSVATTMSLSALDGLMMGTRCGSIDAGVVLHLLRDGRDAASIESLLYRRSGLLGVSGVSADMRTLRSSTSPGASRAIAIFTHRVVREAGAMAACLGGLDAIGFTGGIGEHDAALRAEVCAALSHLGACIDETANVAADGRTVTSVHRAESAVEIWVVPTDEGRIAATEALSVVGTRRKAA